MHTREPECIQPRCPPRPFCREGAPAFRRGEESLPSSGWEESPGFSRGEDVKRSSDPFRRAPRGFAMPWSRMRGLYNIVKFFRPFLYACMHLYASGDAYKKGLEKARKPLYIKEKTRFLSLVCIVCINIRGFLPFSRILYKGMMHTMHTRAEAAPERWNQAETGREDVCIPGCIRMHTREPECIQPRCPPRPFCREGAPAFRRGEDVKRSSDPFRRAPRGFAMPWSRMRGLYNIVKFFRPFLYACMHLYASGDAYKKGLEKARKPLYIKEKTRFLSLVCIVCINIRGFLPFSRILYKGMMHTMHTRPRTIPGTLEPSRNGKRRCMHPRMHTDAYT